MYNANDAVARVDSYIVSVAGGGACRPAAAGADRDRRPLGGVGGVADANGGPRGQHGASR